MSSDGEEIVMAGMGGELMCEIIGRAPWLKDGKALVLQPMTKAEELRKYLADNGFVIEKKPLFRRLLCVFSSKGCLFGRNQNSKAIFIMACFCCKYWTILFFIRKNCFQGLHKADALNNTEDFKEEAKELYEIYDEISATISLRDFNK